jgi:hypothetical protein
VLAELFDEFPPGLPLGAVQGTSLDGAETDTGSETESEAGSSGEWSVGGSEWVAHVCSP